jgi:hypothetical protein
VTRRFGHSRRFVVVAALAAFLVLGATTGLAAASNRTSKSRNIRAMSSVAIGVGINTATITSNGGPGGSCTWNVNADVTAVNLTGSALSVANESDAPGRIDWSDSNGNSGSVTSQTTITWPNSSTGYATIPANSLINGTSVSTFTIPCSATNGELSVNVDAYPGTYPNLGPKMTVSGDTPFLQNGTHLPILVGIGGLGVASVMGGLLLMRMGRRNSPATS